MRGQTSRIRTLGGSVQEPSHATLVDSVVAAFGGEGIEISRNPSGRLTIVGNEAEPVDPPVPISFSADELRDYYRPPRSQLGPNGEC